MENSVAVSSTWRPAYEHRWRSISSTSSPRRSTLPSSLAGALDPARLSTAFTLATSSRGLKGLVT